MASICPGESDTTGVFAVRPASSGVGCGSCCCCQSLALFEPTGDEDDMACLSTGVIPKVQRLTGVGSVSIPAATASSVTVTVLAGTTTVALGADPAQTIPAGASLTWSVESCSQKLVPAILVTNDTAADDALVSWTL